MREWHSSDGYFVEPGKMNLEAGVKIKSAFALLSMFFASVNGCLAQQPSSTPQPAPAPASAQSNSKGIQDNSFLIEESYNQDEGVVQHINSFTRQRNGDWVYSFTQEWPAPSIKHQLSYSIPVMSFHDLADGGRGIGDIALNYRYQLIGDGDAKVAVSPRFTLLIPTGDSKKNLGNGAVGYQFNVPLSVVLSKAFVTHFNAGMTFTPSAKNERGEKANLKGVNLGQSTVWLTSPNFNVLLEWVWINQASVVGQKMTERSNSLLVNPGIRWAYNFKSGLQIVPGISVPLGLGPSHGERSILFYLSFEHPFKKIHEKS
ncbi:MAG: hypothetical protein V7641_2497 [Blastocatellia bacterium]